MKTLCRFLLLLLFCVGSKGSAETFLWRGPADEFASYNELKNWAVVDGAVTNTATRLPGVRDRLADRQSLLLDLDQDPRDSDDELYEHERGHHFLDGWSLLSDWGRWSLSLRNGGLSFCGKSSMHGGTITIGEGASLSFGATSKLVAGVNDARARLFVVEKGGALFFEEGSTLEIYNFGIRNERGGKVHFRSSSVRVTAGAQHSKIENFGTMDFLNGFSLGEGKGSKAAVHLYQKDGLMSVDGIFSTNKSPSALYFHLEGGRLVSQCGKAVFDVTQFEMPDNAAAEIIAGSGGNISIKNGSFGKKTRLLKTGVGVLGMECSFPESFIVKEGALRLTGNGEVKNFDKIEFHPGTRCIFASPGIEINAFPQKLPKFEFDLSAYQHGDEIVRSSNPAVLQHVKTELAKGLQKGFLLESLDNALVLKSETEAIRSGDWDDPSIWKARYVPRENSEVVIRGHRVTVSGKQTLDHVKSIVLAEGGGLVFYDGGRRVYRNTNHGRKNFSIKKVLPPLKMVGGKTSLEVFSTLIATNSFVCVADASGKPRVEVGGDGTLRLSEQVDSSAVTLLYRGNILNPPKKASVSWVDSMNRCFYIDASGMSDACDEFYFEHSSYKGEGTLVRYFLPPKHQTRRRSPLYRCRLSQRDLSPFSVLVKGYKEGKEIYSERVTVVPNENPLAPPAPNHEILVGQTVYRAWDRFCEDIIDNDLCNLLVMWKTDGQLDLKHIKPELLQKAKDAGMRFMTIYGNASPDTAQKLREQYGKNYLNNNIGEYASYLYQGAAQASRIPQGMNLQECRDHFVNVLMQQKLGHYRKRYDYLFSTSGSALACYEMQGGLEFICNELYAMGAQNLAYASSEARGAARRWGPEYWCSWLAEEWQTFGVPYNEDQNYALLLAGLYQQYLMGTSLMVLESGAQSTQAHAYKNYEPGGEKGFRQWYNDYAPTRYRETVKHFYDYVRKHPRAHGTPETQIAFVLGNYDAYVGMTHPIFAIWGQHEQAKTNANWRCGAPEYTWNRIKRSFFPLPSDSLAPYSNHWLAGSPYGQCDVVNLDNESFFADISRYQLLCLVGWNTMTQDLRELLDRHVWDDGILVTCLPHYSTRIDREFKHYTHSDLEHSMQAKVKETNAVVSGKILLTDWGRIHLPGLRGRIRDLPELKDFRVGELQSLDGYKVLATIGGKPLLVLRESKSSGSASVDEGQHYLFLGWEYPGDCNPYADFFAGAVETVAKLMKHRVTVEPVSPEQDDCSYISYAVYPATFSYDADNKGRNVIYLANMDCVKPHTIRVVLRNRIWDRSIKFREPHSKRVREITLPPCSMVTLSLSDLQTLSSTTPLPPSKAARFVPPTKEEAERLEATQAHQR